MLRIGMIGHGAIGKDVLRAWETGELEGSTCSAILVRRPRDDQPPQSPPVYSNPDGFFSHPMEAVLEIAGHQAVRDHAMRVLESGADLIVTSVGAFSDATFFQRVMDAAKTAGKRVIVPSAGVGALDMLAAAAQGGLDEVVMTVRKDAESWKGTAAEDSHDLAALEGPTLLFDGTAREGAAAYPQNVNISAAVALAGIGLDRTRLRIFAEPGEHPHVVEVEARGRFGSFHFREDVVVSEENRKTGIIVAMAIVKTLRQLTSTLVVGH